jgi:UDPglucose 6-dehydrogenase
MVSKHNICVIGSGYVGLVSGVCLAEMGHNVVCVDNNKEKIKKLKNGIVTIYEPGIEKLLIKNKKLGRLIFTDSISVAVKKSDIIFIAVNTPTKEDGFTDLRYVEDVAKDIARSMDSYKIVVGKSTMPVKTGRKIKEILLKYCKNDVEFDVVSNPEFLKEGEAVYDFLHPDRVVIGVESEKARKIMHEVYAKIKAPIIFTSIESAEIIKHSCNAYLATKISFINAIANICEKNGGDIDEIVLAMGLDKRIGKKFLNPGIGFGGSCFPKDIAAFIGVAKESGYEFGLLKEVEKINKDQRLNFVKKIEDNIGRLNNKEIGVLGLSFKPNTDDIRNAPSIEIINCLLERGATVKVYDPVAMDNAKNKFGNKIIFCNDIYKAAEKSDVLIILTEWKEFRKMNLKKINKLLTKPIIIDGRNIFKSRTMERAGIKYVSIGKKT